MKVLPRKLTEMSLEELWQLFPIVLSPHRREWAEWASDEIGELSRILDGYATRISHIGSTAVPDIMAKPIIDILVELSPDADRSRAMALMEAAGYLCMSSSPCRMSFNKGYTYAGYAEKVFHIHIHMAGDNDEIRFRDQLRAHPDEAREYERLKLSLLPEYRYDRDGYTAAKTGFVNKIVRLAKSPGSAEPDDVIS